MGLVNLGKKIGKSIKNRYKEEVLAGKQRAVAMRVIRKKARTEALREKEKQSIYLAKEKEKLKAQQIIKNLKQTPKKFQISQPVIGSNILYGSSPKPQKRKVMKKKIITQPQRFDVVGY